MLRKSRRHRRCEEQRSLIAKFVSNLYTKHLPQNSYQESVRYISVTLCAIGTSVILRLSPFLPFLCVPHFIRALVYHSKFWKLTSLTPRTLSAKAQHNTCKGHIILQEQEKPWRTYGDSCDKQGEKTECRAFVRIDKIGTFLLLIDLIGEK